jgi:YcxB-like protein
LFGSHANFSGMLELESKICVDVQLTAADLDELWKNSPVKYLAWILIVIGVGSSYMLVAELVNGAPLFIIIEWTAAVVLGLLGGAFVLPLRVRRMFRASPTLQESRQYSLSESGVHYDSQLVNCDVRWAAFPSICEGRRAFLLYYSSYISALVIPKRCFSTPSDVARARVLFQDHFKGKLTLRG